MQTNKNNSALSFRIWDRALQKWVEEYQSGTHAFTETYISLSGEVVRFSAGFPERDEEPLFEKEKETFFHEGKFWADSERFVVQRGTGMRDVHGAEIFEGDILRADESVAQVIYFDGAFWAEEIGQTGENTLLFVHSWEVIGNIFENSELVQN